MLLLLMLLLLPVLPVLEIGVATAHARAARVPTSCKLPLFRPTSRPVPSLVMYRAG